jgi:ribosomal-protein-alanine N-acetyltransferase
MPKYFLTTKRLGFRVWSEDDLDLALGLWGDPKVTKLIDARGQLTEDQVRERLLLEIANNRSHGIQYWPIFLLENNEHVGCCGLWPYDQPEGILELGVHIRSQHWGCGYATEAACAAIGYAFEQRRVRGLFAGPTQRTRPLDTSLENWASDIHTTSCTNPRDCSIPAIC